MLRELLHRFAGTRPLRVIMAEGPDADGIDRGWTPLFERYFLFEIPRFVPKLGGGAVYLHHYLRSDPDHGVHDHPWDHAIAVQLCGGYVEERFAGVSPEGMRKAYKARKPGRGYLLRGSDFHRVLTDSRPATSWSLFAHGPYRKGWGFLQDTSILTLDDEVVADENPIIEFRPFKNENDGSSKWWLDRFKHPAPNRQRHCQRADAHGKPFRPFILSPAKDEGRDLERAARLVDDVQ